MRTIRLMMLILVLVLGAGSACQRHSSPSDPAMTTGLALIEDIDVLMLESFPVQVHVRMRGVLGDSCTTLDQITQRREGNFFWITVTTRRPAEAMCADVVTVFEQTTALDVYGLPAGTYRVDVNGVQETFTLTADNILRSTASLSTSRESGFGY